MLADWHYLRSVLPQRLSEVRTLTLVSLREVLVSEELLLPLLGLLLGFLLGLLVDVRGLLLERI